MSIYWRTGTISFTWLQIIKMLRLPSKIKTIKRYFLLHRQKPPYIAIFISHIWEKEEMRSVLNLNIICGIWGIGFIIYMIMAPFYLSLIHILSRCKNVTYIHIIRGGAVMRWVYGTIYKKIRKSKHISQEEVCAVVLLNLYDYRLKMYTLLYK